ncbi:MAG: hypothetical protein PF542_00260 [Nanoarchaeota archaeon]|jgi:hypothetical protein|nr:hypothetical protein [Nanoarchaeota archaeon]
MSVENLVGKDSIYESAKKFREKPMTPEESKIAESLNKAFEEVQNHFNSEEYYWKEKAEMIRNYVPGHWVVGSEPDNKYPKR